MTLPHVDRLRCWPSERESYVAKTAHKSAVGEQQPFEDPPFHRGHPPGPEEHGQADDADQRL